MMLRFVSKTPKPCTAGMIGSNGVKLYFFSAILVFKTTMVFIFLLSREFCEISHVLELCVLLLVELAMLVKQ